MSNNYHHVAYFVIIFTAKRNLETKGLKAELISRLQEYISSTQGLPPLSKHITLPYLAQQESTTAAKTQSEDEHSSKEAADSQSVFLTYFLFIIAAYG